MVIEKIQTSTKVILLYNIIFKVKRAFSESNKALGNYEMIKVIGRGTYGKVLLVKNKLDNSIYALKILNKANILKSDNIECLKSEKDILLNIVNPFIVKLHYTFQNDEKIFMAFDYHNGGELFFHLQRFNYFTESMSKFYAAELYCALTYLHKNKIVYRDLKPENVILDLQGHIKLIDFGLATKIKPDKFNCSSFCGTVEYIPPEVLQGKSYSFNFDWWGFGILIYEMLFGEVKFL